MNYECLKIRCSPIVQFNGKDVYMVNVSTWYEPGSSKVCGIQFPQKHLAYCEGFSREEVDELISYLGTQEEKLRNEASLMPPVPDDVPIEDSLFI